MEVQWFILRKYIVFQGFRGVLSFFQEVKLFPGGGGGGGGGGVGGGQYAYF